MQGNPDAEFESAEEEEDEDLDEDEGAAGEECEEEEVDGEAEDDVIDPDTGLGGDAELINSVEDEDLPEPTPKRDPPTEPEPPAPRELDCTTTPPPKRLKGNPDLARLTPTPPTASLKSPAELHYEIRPSPTAGPSGLQAKREELWAKLSAIKELQAELGISCLRTTTASSIYLCYVYIIHGIVLRTD